jgi:hypothetical protein
MDVDFSDLDALPDSTVSDELLSSLYGSSRDLVDLSSLEWSDVSSELDREQDTRAAHCARCHSTFDSDTNRNGSCVLPHIFTERMNSDGRLISACCGKSVCADPVTHEIIAYSPLGESGLDMCFRGMHTSDAKIVMPHTNGLNRVACSSSRSCFRQPLATQDGRPILTNSLFHENEMDFY